MDIQDLDQQDVTIQATKAEFDKTLSESQKDWEEKKPPFVGNEQFSWGKNAIIFRRNNFIVSLFVSSNDTQTAEQMKELSTYAVLIDNKIQ